MAGIHTASQPRITGRKTGTDALDTWLPTFTATMSSGQSYADPTSQNVTDFINGLYALMRGDATSTLVTALGFTISQG